MLKNMFYVKIADMYIPTDAILLSTSFLPMIYGGNSPLLISALKNEKILSY